MTIEEFCKETELDLTKVHHAEFIQPHPDYFFEIKHKKGDHVNSWFKTLTGYEFPWNNKIYDDDIIEHVYEDISMPITKFIGNYMNLPKYKRYIYKENDRYPIWYSEGIHIYDTDKYGNIANISHQFYLGNLMSTNEIKNLVSEINLKVNYVQALR